MRPLKLNLFGWIALLLVIIGALNWLLVGVFEYDLVAEIFGDLSTAARVIYTLVGVGGVYLVLEAIITFAPRAMPAEKGKHASQH